MWARLLTWRFWALCGVLVLDALVFFVPVVAVALVLGALFAPSWLRVMARFLEALAAAER